MFWTISSLYWFLCAGSYQNDILCSENFWKYFFEFMNRNAANINNTIYDNGLEMTVDELAIHGDRTFKKSWLDYLLYSTNDLPCIDSNNQCVLFLSDKRFGQFLKINISKMVVLISIITEKYVKIIEIKNISKRTKNT